MLLIVFLILTKRPTFWSFHSPGGSPSGKLNAPYLKAPDKETAITKFTMNNFYKEKTYIKTSAVLYWPNAPCITLFKKLKLRGWWKYKRVSIHPYLNYITIQAWSFWRGHCAYTIMGKTHYFPCKIEDNHSAMI